MKTIGSLVSSLAYGESINPVAAQAIYENTVRIQQELGLMGIPQQTVLDLIEKGKTRYLTCLNLCESPIEQIMLCGLAFMVIPSTDCFPPAIHDVQSGAPWPVRPVVIAPQFNIARYRLDFLVQVKTKTKTVKFAIECDGKKHHQEIKDRIRDFDRDEYLEALGIKTVRYSGAWIYKNSWTVADEIRCLIADELK
jgi:very-short-patch-repair endonuclease